jgi:hypothetical protein
MARTDSTLDPDEIARARVLLGKPPVSRNLWPVLAAAAFAAVAAVGMAVGMLLAPPVITEHPIERPGAAQVR